MATRYFALIGAMTVDEAIDAIQGKPSKVVLTAGYSVAVYGIAELTEQVEAEQAE